MSDSVSYSSVAKDRLDFIPSNSTPLVMTTMKNYAEGETPVMASNKRITVLTGKRATVVKVFSRFTGSFKDLTELHTTQIVDMAFLNFDSNVFVSCARGGDVKVSSVSDSMGDIEVNSKSIQFSEDLVKVALIPVLGTSHSDVMPLGNKEVIGLSANGTLHVGNLESGETRTISSKTTSVQEPFLAICNESRIVACPGSRGSIVLTSIDSGKQLLEKSWAPHGGEDVSAVAFIQKPSVAHGTLIVTTAGANTEISLWSLKEAVVNLQHNVCISGATETDAVSDRLFTIDPQDEYVVLGSGSNDDASLVVLQIDQTRARFTRATDWNPQAGVVAISGITRKRKQGAQTTVECAVLIRTQDKVSMLTFDNEKLQGPANLDGEDSGKPSSSNVLKWFGNAEQGQQQQKSQRREGGAVVSSTIDGKRDANSGNVNAANVEKKALAALQSQAAIAAETLREVDRSVVQLQHLASQGLQTLQAKKLQDSARDAGLSHATRSSVAGKGPGGATQLPPSVNNTIREFSAGVQMGIRESTVKCCEDALQRSLPITTERVMDYAEQVEKSNSAQPKLTSTESVMQFQAAVERLQTQQMKNLKAEAAVNSRNMMLMVGASKDSTEHNIRRFRTYMEKLAKEVTGLRSEVRDLKATAGNSAVASGSVVAMSIDKLLALAEAGSWAAAFSAAVETRDVDMLINFLESDVVSDNHDVVCDPKTLPYSVMLSVVQQLAFDLRGKKGAIPLRVMWIADFAVEWDSQLNAMIDGDEGAENARLVKSNANEFAAIADNLDAANVKGEIDSSTRRYLNVAKKVFRALLGE